MCPINVEKHGRLTLILSPSWFDLSIMGANLPPTIHSSPILERLERLPLRRRKLKNPSCLYNFMVVLVVPDAGAPIPPSIKIQCDRRRQGTAKATSSLGPAKAKSWDQDDKTSLLRSSMPWISNICPLSLPFLSFPFLLPRSCNQPFTLSAPSTKS